MEENKLNLLQKVIVIGGSAGSLDVLLEVLPNLTPLHRVAIVIVLHRRNSDDHILEELLRMKSRMSVVEIEDKTQLSPGNLYVAPADYHLLFEESSCFSLDVSEKIHYSRPSIDVAFESAAFALKDRLVAILLSGANADGANGLLSVKKENGIAIVQSPETAEVPYMPQSALNSSTNIDHILSPSEITAFINGISI